jgi:hypothetical protein
MNKKTTKIIIEYKIFYNIVRAVIHTTNSYMIKKAYSFTKELMLIMKNESIFIVADYWYINKNNSRISTSSQVLTEKNLNQNKDWINMQLITIEDEIYCPNKILEDKEIIDFFNRKKNMEKNLKNFIEKKQPLCAKNTINYHKAQHAEMLKQLKDLTLS